MGTTIMQGTAAGLFAGACGGATLGAGCAAVETYVGYALVGPLGGSIDTTAAVRKCCAVGVAFGGVGGAATGAGVGILIEEAQEK